MDTHALTSRLMAPDWLIGSLGALFLAFAAFYVYRLCRPSVVRQAIGFFDWEGELGHAVCMLAMASHLAPWLVPVPNIVWSFVLGLGTLCFALRALTWGRRLAYNKQWWDWTHSGMYLGMFTMFQPLPLGPIFSPVFSWAMILFWGWFSLYYIRDSILDARAGRRLSFGSDLAHLGMGLVMLLMTLFPSLLMPTHTHHEHGQPPVIQEHQPEKPMDSPHHGHH